jgi:hypothetical protein
MFFSRFNPAYSDPTVSFRESFDEVIETVNANRNVDPVAVGGHLKWEAFSLRRSGHIQEPTKKPAPPSIRELKGHANTRDLLPRLSAFLESAVESGVPASNVAALAEHAAALFAQ